MKKIYSNPTLENRIFKDNSFITMSGLQSSQQVSASAVAAGTSVNEAASYTNFTITF